VREGGGAELLADPTMGQSYLGASANK